MSSSRDMRVFTQPPCAALRPFVKRFFVIECAAELRDSHLPDTGLVAAFPFRGECRLDDGTKAPRAGLTGLWDRRRHHTHSRDNAIVLAAFGPAGAAAFFRESLDEFANATAPLENVIGGAPALALLDEQLGAAPSPAARIRLVEDFLLARLRARAPDALVAAAVEWIERAPPEARIEQLVRHIGLSQSALERRFRRVVGVSPKRFASLVRIGKIVRLRATGASLTSIAHAAGYFDQPHFIHDFKRVTGVAPESYFAKTS
jgi:AraC-like DNA-binding protein